MFTKHTHNMWRMSLAAHQGQMLEGVTSLTENPDVKVLELLSYTRVDLMTLREVNWNDTDFTTILLLWEMSSEVRERRERRERRVRNRRRR